MADANDMDLVREFARQYPGTAFAELVRRHINLVYSVTLRFTGNPGDAQDVTQTVIDPAKPMPKLGLDVHLEFIMAVAQKDHGNPQAPRKFPRLQLVAQVKQRTAKKAKGISERLHEPSTGWFNNGWN